MKKVFSARVAKIPFTKQGYEKILQQKVELLGQRPAAVENLRKAREMGDLSENGYYKAARAKLSFLDAQLRRLERLIRFGAVVESTGSEKVEIGSRVVFTDGRKNYEYTVVGSYESDPSKQTISYISPIGKALLGKKEHDNVQIHAPAGTVSYTILKIIVPGAMN